MFWVYGRIESIDTNARWYYLSCMRCSKKLSTVGDGLFCEKCNVSDPSGNVRYKIMVSITDDSGFNVPLLIWNREAVQLIGKTASDLKNIIDQVSNYIIIYNPHYYLFI